MLANLEFILNFMKLYGPLRMPFEFQVNQSPQVRQKSNIKKENSKFIIVDSKTRFRCISKVFYFSFRRFVIN